MSRFNVRLLAALLLLSATAFAQTTTATLKGRVADAAGNVVPGATVALVQTTTGQRKSFTADDAGRFTFTFLEPGLYTVEAQAPGFKSFRQPDLKLDVAQTAELNIELQPGEVSETVEVRAGGGQQLETASGALGGVVAREQIDSLPLNGRNVLQLATLEPGINTSAVARASNASSTSAAALSINGGRAFSNEILVDGNVVTQKADNFPALRPSADAVQEFRVLTNSYSAEYGRAGGGTINIATRQGTKQFRATLFEFLRNDAFDATSFFSNRAGSGKEKNRFNQFGGNFGGPVWLPRFGAGGRAASKTERAFFFVNYESLVISQSTQRQSTVPTAKMRNGDFSELLGAVIPNVTVRDTAGNTIPARLGMIYAPGALVATGQPGAGSRIAYAGNVIPAAQINPVGLAALRYYPQPNRVGTVNPSGVGFNNNFIVNEGQTTDNRQLVARVDYSLSAKQQLFGRVIKEWNIGTAEGPLVGSIASTTADHRNSQRPASIVLDYVNTLAPTAVMRLNAGWSRFNIDRLQEVFDPVTLGFPTYLAATSHRNSVFPSFAPVGYATMGPSRNNGNNLNSQDTFNVTADLSLIRGAHSLKFGTNGRLYRIYNDRPDDPAGNFTFTRAFSARTQNDTSSGDAIASFLLGNPAAGRLGATAQPVVESRYFAAFAQDDWTFNRRLTLNLGLRYEIDFPNTERFNRLTNFRPEATFPVANITAVFPASTGLGTRQLALRGQFTPVGRGQFTNNEQQDRDLNNWGPRVGMAFKLNDKTVLRGGGGIFYSSISGGGLTNATYAIVGDTGATTFIASLNNGLTPNPGANLSNPFPTGITQPATIQLDGLLGYGQSGIPARLRETHQPYISQWNLSVQRELPGRLIAEIAYAGNAGVSLLTGATSINQIPTEAATLGATILNTTVPNPFLSLPAEQRMPTAAALSTATLTVAQLLRPFPQFGDIISYFNNGAHSSYHALQTKVGRRIAGGLSFQAAYTFAKLIDDISAIQAAAGVQLPTYQDYYNRRADKSLSSFDVRHRAVVNFNFPLPFGRRGQYFKTGVLGAALGGFQFNGITQFQSGFPLHLNAVNAALGGLAFNTLRPNLVADPRKQGATRDQLLAEYFNTAAFTQPAAYAFGTSPRTLSNVRGPNFFSTNLGVSRNFAFTETVRLQFRVEAYNLFNRANFNLPGITFGGANFGVINGTQDPRQLQLGVKLFF